MLWENLEATAFQAHPYHNPIVGWASDIDNLRREEVLRYFKTFYAPNNCIAAIVGDIDPVKTMAILEKYFGGLPPQPQPRREISEEPRQMGERRVGVTFDAQPELDIGYHTPQIGHEDSYALEVLAELLSGVEQGSRTGRLYKSLVLGQKVALRVRAEAATDLYPSLFTISATPAQGRSGEEVEKAVYAEIEKLETEPPTPEELERVRNAADADLIRGLRSNFRVAFSIASAQHLTGSWRYILTERDKLKAVTGEDIQRVAKKYFSAENRTVAELRPKSSGQAAGRRGEEP